MSRHLGLKAPVSNWSSLTSSHSQNENVRFELDLGRATTLLNVGHERSVGSLGDLDSDFKIKLTQADWQARLKFYNNKQKFTAFGLGFRPTQEIQNQSTVAANSVFGSRVYTSNDMIDATITETGVWFTRGREFGSELAGEKNWEVFWALYAGAQFAHIETGKELQTHSHNTRILLQTNGYHAESKMLADATNTSLEKTTPMSRVNFGATRKLSTGFGITAQASVPVALNVKGIDIKMLSYRVGIVVSPKHLKENIMENL